MEIKHSLYVATRQAWREWLAEHHASQREVWLVFYKQHTGQPSLPYADALDEALCYGWIDSIIQKIDEERYARKFTPRTNTAKWSEVNLRRVAVLIQEGRMTPAGLAKLGDAQPINPAIPRAAPPPLEIPPQVEQTLRANPLAWENFCKLPPSHRKRYLGWALSAKRAGNRGKAPARGDWLAGKGSTAGNEVGLIIGS